MAEPPVHPTVALGAGGTHQSRQQRGEEGAAAFISTQSTSEAPGAMPGAASAS